MTASSPIYVLPDMLPSVEVFLWPGFRVELTINDCGGQI